MEGSTSKHDSLVQKHVDFGILENNIQDPTATPMYLPMEFLKTITCDFSKEQELGRVVARNFLAVGTKHDGRQLAKDKRAKFINVPILLVMLTLHQIMTQIVFQIKRTILEVAHLLGVQKVENLIKTYLATHENIAAMLKGRPLDSIKEYVAQWVIQNYPAAM
uniref:Uncharacterized protein n=1 Tax=Oryza rufipogon TaxID=4529 RepID=A0A0E0QYZ9_ORYRU